MTDADLLHRYTTDASEAAFAELVERHLNLVYSVARRHVPSSALAEDVAQSVFIELARQARRIEPDMPLIAWLHVVSRRTALNTLRSELRRQARETAAAELDTCGEHVESAMKPTPSVWAEVEPLLDEAVETLAPADRSAILLRFFENKSLRDVGAALGTTEDTAQKRVSRAVEQLRTFFLRRGIAVTAAGLATDLSAHALQIAPAGLGASIATTAASATATLGAAQGVATTVLPKLFVATLATVALGVAFFETRTFLHQRAELAAAPGQISRLNATLATLGADQAAARQRLQSSRAGLAHFARANVGVDPEIEAAVEAWLARAARLRQLAAARSDLGIPELVVLDDNDWMVAAKDAKFDPEAQLLASFRPLQQSARNATAKKLHSALIRYAAAHDDRLPGAPTELASFVEPRVPAALFERYEMLQRGNLSAADGDARVLAERLTFARAFGNRVFVTPQKPETEDLPEVSNSP